MKNEIPHLHAGTAQVDVVDVRPVAAGIVAVELRPASGASCASFDAGAHLDLYLPNGLVRQYSLINVGERDKYVVAVSLDPRSRGGSAYIHESLRAGDQIGVGVPRNNFRLDDSTAPAILFAGGIGITPIWSMVKSLETRGRPWVLYYCARTTGHAAFLDEIRQFAVQSRVGRLMCNFDQEPGQTVLSFAAELALHSREAHFYCCGPQPMLAAFEAAAAEAAIPPSHIHVERFSAEPADASGDVSFELELASGATYTVPAGKSILDVLTKAGEPVMYSCKEGTCGTCETAVLEGEPLHRDVILSAAERAGNRTMMICVSRCKGKKLKLDI